MPNRQSFEAEWPPVARRLQAALRHRKVPRTMTEDLVQETGLRLFEIWDRVDPDREVWPLALTIALNILRDHIRTQSRRTQIAIPDAQLDHDTEVIALARVELEQVHAALAHLTVGQRSALLAEIGAAEQPDESASSLKMLRLRGRKRLRTLIDDASAAVASFELVLQRAWRATPAAPFGEQLVPCVSVAAGLLCAATFGGLGATPDGRLGGNAGNGPSASHTSANAIGLWNQSVPFAIGTRSATWVRDIGQMISGGLESAAGGETGRRAEELEERHIRITPTGPDGRHKKPRTGPRPDGVRVRNPRAEVSPDGYRVGGGGDAQVKGQGVGAGVDAESGNNHGEGLTSESLPGPGTPDASAKVEVEDVGDVEYSSTGERAGGTSSSNPSLKEAPATD